MRILFVLNSHFWERIGILILSSILKKHQHTVSIYNINQRTVEQYIEEIKQLKPEVIAYSSMTTEIATFLQTNRELKSNLPFEWKSVFGGPHPTFFPEMIHEAGVDALLDLGVHGFIQQRRDDHSILVLES